MRRILPMIAVAAVALSASNVFATAELLQQMGGNFDGVGTPGAGPGGNPVIAVTPGTVVNIPIWMTPLQGDNGTFTAIRTFNFEASGLGDLGSFTPVSSFNRGIYSNCVNGGAALPADADVANLPGSQLLFRAMGCNPAPSDNGMRSDNGGLAPDVGGAYYIGYYTVQVNATATPGQSLSLYFHTPRSGNRYTMNNTTGSLNNIGYGVNGDGTPNEQRLLNGAESGIIIGTLNNQVSTLADATIRVIPEPATIGLLAVAVLGLRRRLA